MVSHFPPPKPAEGFRPFSPAPARQQTKTERHKDHAGRLRAWVGRIRQWHRRRIALRQLGGLDDRLLRDIGLDRAGIETMVDALLEAERNSRD